MEKEDVEKEDNIPYMQWNITQPQKEWSNAICSNLDRPRD